MSKTIVFTDLDGTLLEEDGSVSAEALAVLGELRGRGVHVVPLTSKTQRELKGWLRVLDAGDAGAFENGAGILFEGKCEILPGAVVARDLRPVLDTLRRETGLPLFPFEEIPDGAMTRLTGLSPAEAAAAREREYDVPFVAPEEAAEQLRRAPLPPGLRLSRGGRFWHLSGAHDKADALRALLARFGGGETIGFGDASNDATFLAAVDRAVLVPRPSGVDAALAERFPGAVVAPAPAGAGWAAAVRRLVLDAAGPA